MTADSILIFPSNLGAAPTCKMNPHFHKQLHDRGQTSTVHTQSAKTRMLPQIHAARTHAASGNARENRRSSPPRRRRLKCGIAGAGILANSSRSRQESLATRQIHATNPRLEARTASRDVAERAERKANGEPERARSEPGERTKGKRKKRGKGRREMGEIRGTARFTHHEGVDEEVVVLEGGEGGGGVDAVLAVLAELEGGDDGAQGPEHHVVEHLHRLLR